MQRKYSWGDKIPQPVLDFKNSATISTMNLSVGIVGLPNVGKSTLFNALLKRQITYVANYPLAW